MKNYQRILAVTVLGMMIIPQVTFAAWWNPLSWGIFSFMFQNSEQTQMTTEVTTPTDVAASSTTEMSSTTSTSAVSTNTVISKPIPPKVSAPAPTKSPSVKVQAPQAVQPTGTLCNGTYWNACPTGQNLICPQTGDAYCQLPQQPIQKQVIVQPMISSVDSGVISGQNFSGVNAVYVVNTSNGTRTDLPFSYISDSTIEVHASVPVGQYNLYVANSAGGVSSPYQTEVAASQTTQQVQQSAPVVDNSACQTASKNLEKFQNSYAYGQNFGGAAEVASKLAQIFGNEYNTELPAYQIAAQAACGIPQPIPTACMTALQNFDAFQAQYPLNPAYTSGGVGMTFALRFPAQQSAIQYACQ
jgi:hypothetical protein